MKLRWNFLLIVPLLVTYFGVGLNTIATSTNGGKMPVAVPGGCETIHFDWNHTCMTPQTKHKVLGDWIVSNAGVASIGDMFIGIAADLKDTVLIIWLGALLLHALKKVD